MRGQLEDFAAVHADALKNAVAIEKTVVIHADHGLIGRHKFAINEDHGTRLNQSCHMRKVPSK